MKLYGEENNTAIMKELGKRLQDIRVSAMIKQADMAALAGVSPRTIERMEHGEKVNIVSILNVMRVLGLLAGLDALIPEQSATPYELHTYGKKRQRATKKQESAGGANTFIWGDEK